MSLSTSGVIIHLIFYIYILFYSIYFTINLIIYFLISLFKIILSIKN